MFPALMNWAVVTGPPTISVNRSRPAPGSPPSVAIAV
jgi:hypothetical protein